MVAVTTKNTFLYSRQEVWFYNGEKVTRTSNNMYYQSFVKPSFEVSYLKETLTTLIDLRENEEVLFSQVDGKYRNEIRRAEKLNAMFKCEDKPDSSFLTSYLKSYSQFAKVKSLDPNLSLERLKAFSESEVLRITSVSIDEKVVTIHAYLVDDKQVAVLLYSHHNVDYADNAARGFANKFHHWKDIMFFKQNGIKHYDMGGLDFVNTPGIAEFKKSFGGTEHKAYNFQTTSRLYKLLKK